MLSWGSQQWRSRTWKNVNKRGEHSTTTLISSQSCFLQHTHHILSQSIELTHLTQEDNHCHISSPILLLYPPHTTSLTHHLSTYLKLRESLQLVASSLSRLHQTPRHHHNHQSPNRSRCLCRTSHHIRLVLKTCFCHVATAFRMSVGVRLFLLTFCDLGVFEKFGKRMKDVFHAGVHLFFFNTFLTFQRHPSKDAFTT
ncbi:hypothetical protein BLNAU_3108 [Blattamonas nauphoetae]|uniref:Uncharacterized protein n=1 Tax=Blattamonas nauphoetae TaxID=2049346 RepID=A0ABQ9YE57_9EUKA|nr:hypothetical protein BLNAU_3108 [Blattamonas nauphoetae]